MNGLTQPNSAIQKTASSSAQVFVQQPGHESFRFILPARNHNPAHATNKLRPSRATATPDSGCPTRRRLSSSAALSKILLKGPGPFGLAYTLEPNFKIDRLDIASREKVQEQRFQKKGYPSDIYKVQGTVETTLTVSSRKVQQASPFELYLGRDEPPSRPAQSQRNSSANPTSNSADSAPKESIETWYLIASNQPKLPQ